MIKSVYSNTSLFGVEEAKLRPLERLLMSLEGQLLDGVILQVFSYSELYLLHYSRFSANYFVSCNSEITDTFTSFCDLISWEQEWNNINDRKINIYYELLSLIINLC